MNAILLFLYAPSRGWRIHPTSIESSEADIVRGLKTIPHGESVERIIVIPAQQFLQWESFLNTQKQSPIHDPH